MRVFSKSFHSIALAAALALILAGVLTGMAQRANSASLKELMGDNFQNVQVMLFNLVRSKYEVMPAQIATIRDHAIELGKKMPETIKTDFERKTFISYATQLENNANNMLTVMHELIKHDKSPNEPGKLNIDYLRVVAARQFGEMVTSCVLCHNQFRRYPVK